LSIIKYAVPFTLSNDVGTLALNAGIAFANGNGIYVLNQDDCKSEVPLRVTDSNLPQSDGEQLHHRFFAGFHLRLAVQLWKGTALPPDELACDELLQEMADTLLAMIRGYATATNGQVLWIPDGEAQRMIDDCLLSENYDITWPSGVTQIAFQVKSGLPYAVDAASGTIPV
jgi:hypothetical protein